MRSADVPFKPDEHYVHSGNVGQLEVDHTHWWDSGKCELVSLLRCSLYATSNRQGARGAASEVRQWDVTPAELRRLGNSMIEAADSLEAHHLEHAGVKA